MNIKGKNMLIKKYKNDLISKFSILQYNTFVINNIEYEEVIQIK